MTNILIAFDKIGGITPDETKKRDIKPRYEHVNVNIIFDIKMDGKFTREARLVSDSHTTAPPSSIHTQVLCPGRVLGLHFYLYP